MRPLKITGMGLEFMWCKAIEGKSPVLCPDVIYTSKTCYV